MAALPKTPAGAIALVTGISAIACWLNWGFGLIVGVIFAKEIAKKLRGVDYRLLIASAYSGFVVWHAGLSGSIPLTMATEGSNLEVVTKGALTHPIPIGQTILAPQNLIMVAVVIVAIVLVNALMHPKGDQVVTIEPALLFEEEPKPQPKATTPAEKLENSPVLSWIISLLGLSYLVIKLFFKGGSFDLGAVIMLFLFLGVILHGTPLAYVRAFGKSVGGTAGILLQFPFYAGIMGIITGVGASGICLGEVISNACVSISTPKTYPLFTFFCAAILNMFVPSGGGHWAIQAPIMFTAGGERLPDGHGHLVGRCLDQPDSAFLGLARLGHCQAERKRHHGLLHHRPVCHRVDYLWRLAAVGVIPSERIHAVPLDQVVTDVSHLVFYANLVPFIGLAETGISFRDIAFLVGDLCHDRGSERRRFPYVDMGASCIKNTLFVGRTEFHYPVTFLGNFKIVLNGNRICVLVGAHITSHKIALVV